MPTPPPFITEALSRLGSMLEADGYALELSEAAGSNLVARIEAGPDACADCLVPKDMMRRYFEDALRPVCELGVPRIELVYPGEQT
ncbi:MAG: hypothetical protein P8J20_19790 [Novosphingobium sp.]|nr:hypothetical protein [Novosphingobium sp.]